MEAVRWNRTPLGARPHVGRKRKKNDDQQPGALRVITDRAERESASSRLLTRSPERIPKSCVVAKAFDCRTWL